MLILSVLQVTKKIILFYRFRKYMNIDKQISFLQLKNLGNSFHKYCTHLHNYYIRILSSQEYF